MHEQQSLTQNIRVVSYAGYRAEESPLRFFLGQRKIEVCEVLDRWMGPDHRYFKVRGDDGARYILRHDTVLDSWDLTMFDRTGA
jgi:hypothetical protein